MADKYEKIYFYIVGPANKSNTWIALLLIGELLKINFFNNDNLKKCYMASYKYIPKDIKITVPTLLLHIDDMAYSGNQMLEDMQYKMNMASSLDWYITTAYIGKSAIKLFNKNQKLGNIKYKLFKNTEIIEIFIKQLKRYVLNKKLNKNRDKNKNKNKIKNSDFYKRIVELCFEPDEDTETLYYGKKSFRCDQDHTLIYFDHKLSDQISTMQSLLYFGAWPTTKECYDLPLITGCKATYFENIADRNKSCYGEVYVGDIPVKHTCPPTFYKQPEFKYKYNRRVIDSSNTIASHIQLINKSVSLKGGGIEHLNWIINPISGHKYELNTQSGIKILRNYISQYFDLKI